MNSSDLKKLITGFLILSAISGSLTLILLNSGDRSAPPTFSASVDAQTQNPLLDSIGSPLAIGKNAFVEQLPQNSLPQGPKPQSDSDSVAANNQITDPSGSTPLTTSNLTQNFANIFAQQVIDHNPQGPQVDSSGQTTALNLPDENAAAALIQQAITSNTFAVDEKISDADIKILTAYTANDTKNYLSAVNSILADFDSNTKRVDTTNESSMPETITVSQLMFEGSLTKLKKVAVPQPLTGLHRSLLQFFANQKKVLEIAGNYQTDPLKAILVLKSENEIVGRDVKRIGDEFLNLPKKLSLYPKEDNKISFLIHEIFGVKKVYAATDTAVLAAVTAVFGANVASYVAQYGTWAVNIAGWVARAVDWIKSHAYEIWKWTYTTALRIAVKLLIDTFQNQVVNWIAGNGDPKFITDWKGFLTDIADKAAGQAISNQLPFLCSNIGPLIRIAVLPVPNLDTSVRCTLTQVIGNVTNFYNSFQNGGWIAYGATLQPQNNFFGGLIMVSDNAQRAAAQAAAAAGQEAVASRGFLSIKKSTGKCLESRKEQGPSLTVCDNINEITGECISSHEENAPIQDVCTKYEEINTTPGAVVGGTLSKALDWPQNQWVSAQRFEELVGAIINAGINRMIKTGLSALTAASNPAPPNFDNATPLGIPNPGGISQLKYDLNNLINFYEQNGTFQKFQDTANADSQWLALQPQAITLLNQVTLGCTILATDSQQKIAALQALKPTVEAEFQFATSTTLASLRAQVVNAKDSQTLVDLTNQLQAPLFTNPDLTATAAKNSLTLLQNLILNAQANLPNNCNVPLIDPVLPPPANSFLPPTLPPGP